MKVTHIVIVQMKMKEGNIVDVSENRARKVFNTGQNPEEHHSSGGNASKELKSCLQFLYRHLHILPAYG